MSNIQDRVKYIQSILPEGVTATFTFGMTSIGDAVQIELSKGDKTHGCLYHWVSEPTLEEYILTQTKYLPE